MMTREEEIKQAAYAQYCNSESISFTLMCDTFNQGAKWADKHPDISSLWHNTSEEPKENMDILFISRNGKVHKVSKVDNSLYSWLKDTKDIKKWAYINDLLPQKE